MYKKFLIFYELFLNLIVRPDILTLVYGVFINELNRFIVFNFIIYFKVAQCLYIINVFNCNE